MLLTVVLYLFNCLEDWLFFLNFRDQLCLLLFVCWVAWGILLLAKSRTRARRHKNNHYSFSCFIVPLNCYITVDEIGSTFSFYWRIPFYLYWTKIHAYSCVIFTRADIQCISTLSRCFPRFVLSSPTFASIIVMNFDCFFHVLIYVWFVLPVKILHNL